MWGAILDVLAERTKGVVTDIEKTLDNRIREEIEDISAESATERLLLIAGYALVAKELAGKVGCDLSTGTALTLGAAAAGVETVYKVATEKIDSVMSDDDNTNNNTRPKNR